MVAPVLPCALFALFFFYKGKTLPKGSDGAFIDKPFTNWKKSTGSNPKDNKLLKHGQSESHRIATERESGAKQMRLQGTSVYSLIHSQSLEEKSENLKIMCDFLHGAYFLFKNEIAHTMKYEQLLNLLAKVDHSGKFFKFMESSPHNATYRSSVTVRQFLVAVGSWISKRVLEKVRASPVLSIMADEATDLRTRTELSLCFRYLVNAEPQEAYFKLTTVTATDANSVALVINQSLESSEISPTKIYWQAYDGAANFSGRKSGVAKLMRENYGLSNSHYIHCRSHLLNLAAANIAKNNHNEWKSLFSAFNSLWKLFHQSPKKHSKLKAVQDILDDPNLELVRVGDTRWTSNYRAVNAIVTCLRAIVVTLQEIHTSASDLSSEAGGLLLTFQNKKSTLMLFALLEILKPLQTLTLVLQSPKLTLADLPTKIEMTTNRLQEIINTSEIYVSQFNKYSEELASYCFVKADFEDYEALHRQLVVPYVNSLLQNMDKRFGDSVGKVSICSKIFDLLLYNPSMSVVEELKFLAQFFRLSNDECLAELSCFKTYMRKAKEEVKSLQFVLKDLISTDISSGGR